MKQYTSAALTNEVTQREIENKEVAYNAALEGIVLLENNNVLPIKKGKIALYGAGAKLTIKGGTGSGEVNERHSISIMEGLENAGFEITTKKYIEDYDKTYDEVYLKSGKFNPFALVNNILSSPVYPFGRLITKEDIEESDTDTAIYVVARQAGEGQDKKIEKGDFDLDKIEIENIKILTENYKKVILVINSGSSMNLSTIDEYKVGAIFFFCQQGMEGGRAFADILLGNVSPSGKLTDTWVKKYDDVPFGDNYSYLSGDTTKEYYKEGIYVGYRYYDTFNVEPRYHFGYGLSYTKFEILNKGVDVKNNIVTAKIEVRNIGKYPGKEVVQIYVSAPDGEIKKEYQRLVNFGKTKLLKPDQSEELSISFGLDYLASYCEKCASYVLEKGDYIVRVGNSSNNTKPYAVIALDEKKILTVNTNICSLGFKVCEIEPKVRKNTDKLDGALKLSIKADKISTKFIEYKNPEVYHDEKVDAIMNKLTLKDKVEVVVGEGVLGMMSSDKLFTPGTVGRTTSKLYNKGLINVNLSDGPAGLRLLRESALTSKGKIRFVKGNYVISTMASMPSFITKPFCAKENDKKLFQYTTAFPVGTALAQSWNQDLMEEVGLAIAKEMNEYDITYWLAPAMNIHKNPLCGRNFEYLSEDPVLTGKIAAGLTRGVQSVPGCYATIKHFACNNVEDNRQKSDSIIDERPLREIYLRGFEIAVKEANAKSVMTSYNKINGMYTANIHDTVTKVLRNEWGFDGVVMTDWFSTGKGLGREDWAMVAGNDLIMPGSGRSKKIILQGIKNIDCSIEDLDRCAANCIKNIVYSNVAVREDRKITPDMFE